MPAQCDLVKIVYGGRIPRITMRKLRAVARAFKIPLEKVEVWDSERIYQEALLDWESDMYDIQESIETGRNVPQSRFIRIANDDFNHIWWGRLEQAAIYDYPKTVEMIRQRRRSTRGVRDIQVIY